MVAGVSQVMVQVKRGAIRRQDLSQIAINRDLAMIRFSTGRVCGTLTFTYGRIQSQITQSSYAQQCVAMARDPGIYKIVCRGRIGEIKSSACSQQRSASMMRAKLRKSGKRTSSFSKREKVALFWRN
ncbi:hypothetical protein HDF13_000166 [Edaphobacter lichenicola]|uniref:Uncharacterized protein n=1 Tax=Tunturiibacter gelidiferens TaxID=3069689 RepID=A0ACC5NTX8_9BACT|nr:hypothetical protein [Edaphobacter lichenicola]